MGKSDFFNDGENHSEEDNLGFLLEKVIKEEKYKEEFYHQLLIKDLIILIQNPEGPSGEQKIEKGTQINLMSYPDGRIPIFTSPSRIYDKGIIKEEVQYVKIKAKDLFTKIQGATFILNPHSEYGKELFPDEIKSLIDGSLLERKIKKTFIEENTEIIIGKPDPYPFQMVESLKEFFSKKKEVNSAYLGVILMSESTELPRYIIGLDVKGNFQEIIKEAINIINKFLNSDQVISFISMDDKNTVRDYLLNEITPFYTQ